MPVFQVLSQYRHITNSPQEGLEEHSDGLELWRIHLRKRQLDLGSSNWRRGK